MRFTCLVLLLMCSCAESSPPASHDPASGEDGGNGDAAAPLDAAASDAAVPEDAQNALDASPQDDAGEATCTGTDTESCERDPRCFAEHAYRADMPGNGTQFATCVPLAMACVDGGAEQTCARADDGTLFIFPSTCLPQGFEEQPSTECDEQGLPASCEDLDPEACETSATCRTIDGRVRAEPGPLMPLGCMAGDTGCGDAETCAYDETATGDLYWFPSTCIPAGWVATPCYIEE